MIINILPYHILYNILQNITDGNCKQNVDAASGIVQKQHIMMEPWSLHFHLNLPSTALTPLLSEISFQHFLTRHLLWAQYGTRMSSALISWVEASLDKQDFSTIK